MQNYRFISKIKTLEESLQATQRRKYQVANYNILRATIWHKKKAVKNSHRFLACNN